MSLSEKKKLSSILFLQFSVREPFFSFRFSAREGEGKRRSRVIDTHEVFVHSQHSHPAVHAKRLVSRQQENDETTRAEGLTSGQSQSQRAKDAMKRNDDENRS